MSGGSLNYFYSDLEEHVGDLGDKELDDLVKDLSKLFHAREWFLSCDTCEGSWVEARDAFKKKWFKDGARKDRIEQYLEEIRKDVLRQFGVSDEYCRNCRKWTPEKKPDDEYGWCSTKKECMMHRSETCDEFERRETE